MNAPTKCFFAAALLSVGTIAWAYDVPKRSLEARVQAADLVAVGTVVRLDDHDDHDSSALGVATVNIGVTLKGASARTIRLVYRGGISELDPVCCVVGKSYVMLLHLTKTGLYSSVDGPYGVLDTEQAQASSDGSMSWPGRPKY